MLARQIAVGDIHGCVRTFRELVRTKLNIQSGDQLILLGDLIDRGPDTKGVIDEIFALKSEGVRVHVLQGNHEELMIAAYYGVDQMEYWRRCGGQDTLNSFGVSSVLEIPIKYREFIQYSEMYFETPECIFVHAGLNFSKRDLFADLNAMRWIRKMEIDPERIGYRKIVHGHTPRPYTEIIKQNKHDINLDAGCAYTELPGMGYLVAYEVGTGEFTYVQNCE